MKSSVRKEGESYAWFISKQIGVSSAAAMWAEFLTIPFDTAKVRMQIQKIEPGQTPKYSGVIGTCKTIAAEEGTLKLWNGLVPGL